jgi:hypothetical protein
MDGDPHAPVIIKAETDISTPEAIDFFRWLGICISKGFR